MMNCPGLDVAEKLTGACFLILIAVIKEYDNTLSFKSLSVLGEVFFGAPEPDFLFGTVPGGNDSADRFN